VTICFVQAQSSVEIDRKIGYALSREVKAVDQIQEDNYSERRIFTVLGVLPEPGGYGIAKFSRASDPYKKWIMDLTQEGAEKFYQTFYFDYGHSSIADLAHITVIFENISMVAAEELWDEPLIDGQASSTRYQDFKKRGFHTPSELVGSAHESKFNAHCELLLNSYHAFLERTHQHLMERHAHERPADMDDGKYSRTLKARAYDVVRYVLPMSIRTGLGHILSARTLERRLIDLLSHPIEEVRDVARDLKSAAVEEPAFNPMNERLGPILEKLESTADGSEIADEIRGLADFGAPATPTLIKYAEPSANIVSTRNSLIEYGTALAPKLGEPDRSPGVTLADPHDQLVEQFATLVYPFVPHAYQQIQNHAENSMSESEMLEALDIVERGRGQFDAPAFSTRSGYQLIFDISLDCGAWRDFHRHRKLVQIHKPFDALEGYDTPRTIKEAGLESEYASLMKTSSTLATEIDQEYPQIGQYVLPFAFRRRSIFKMDAEELQYITELRTRPENHFSVREIAYQMYEAYAARYPKLAERFRIVKPEEENFFKR